MKVGKVVQLEKSVTPLLDADLARVQQEALALARAYAADLVTVTTDLAAYRALLASAPKLLERAARMAHKAGCEDCPERDVCPGFTGFSDQEAWPCNTVPAALRELARGLREAMGEEEKEG